MYARYFKQLYIFYQYGSIYSHVYFYICTYIHLAYICICFSTQAHTKFIRYSAWKLLTFKESYINIYPHIQTYIQAGNYAFIFYNSSCKKVSLALVTFPFLKLKFLLGKAPKASSKYSYTQDNIHRKMMKTLYKIKYLAFWHLNNGKWSNCLLH